MKKKKDCKIVQDLLPNYIEKLTNKETNQYIEEHLEECEDCKKILENMQKDLNINIQKRDSREIKYFKKYNKKLKTLKLIIFIILLIFLGVTTYNYIRFRDAYIRATESLTEIVSEEMYPNTFYATIEEIVDSEVYGIMTIKVKGMDINDINHRGEFSFDIPLDNIPNNFKIRFQGKDVGFEQLKVGQTIAIYNYNSNYNKETEDDYSYLQGVRMIVILEDEL